MGKAHLTSLKFDRAFLESTWRLIKPFWVSKEKWRAWFFFILTMLFTILSIWTSVEFNHLNQIFYDALQNVNYSQIQSALFRFGFILALMVLSYGYAFYFNARLCICWRKWLTEYYLKIWLSEKKYHALELHSKDLDHPDQRLSEDLNLFPELTLNIFSLLITSILTIFSFGFILWHLSPIFSIKMLGFSIHFPGCLFFWALFMGLIGCFVTNYLGRRLVILDYAQQQYNAQFRFALMGVRAFSESIAISNQEDIQKNQLHFILNRIVENFLSISILMKKLTFFTSGYGMFGYLIGILLALPLYLRRQIQLGGLMQISGAFSSLIGAFSTLMKAYHLFASWRATTWRLIEFNRALDLDA